MDYFNDLIKCRCAPDLLKDEMFPNAKEVTESLGCFWAVLNNLPEVKIDDPTVTVYVVGDGTKPRTGAVFAFRTAWNVISIDPIMIQKEYNIKRLTIVSKKIEDYEEGTNNTGTIIIVLPHSHARMPYVMQKLKTSGTRHIVSLPCCVSHEIGEKHYIGYVDHGIKTEKNTIKIWKDI